MSGWRVCVLRVMSTPVVAWVEILFQQAQCTEAVADNNTGNNTTAARRRVATRIAWQSRWQQPTDRAVALQALLAPGRLVPSASQRGPGSTVTSG